jgi:hypothetical protein
MALDPSGPNTAEEWDLTWTRRIAGKHRALFDVPEVESGYGVWRAAIWGSQYQEVLKAAPRDLSTVIVLRHNGIALAMQQAFWDEYGIGKTKSVIHPITTQPTDRNPVLLNSKRDGTPADFDGMSLDAQLARGAIALACNLALRDCVDLIEKKDGISPEAARAKAIRLLVPGVILQPSGVFAAVRAQEAGCNYVRAS